MNIPGSDDPISVPVNVEESRVQETRKRNAVASQKHRDKKKRQQNELSEEVKQLRTEVREMRERVKSMEEEQNSHRDLIMHAQWLIYWAQASDFPSQKSNAAVGVDGLATRTQSYGGRGSPGERRSKHRRTDHVPGFSTPA
jgi:TolA-binding protein